MEVSGKWYMYRTRTSPLCPVGRFHFAENKFNSLKEEITMRVYFTFSRVALVLAVVWMAMGIPAGVYAMESASGSPQVVIAEPTTPANLLNFTEYYETADAKAPAAKEAAPAAEGNCCQGCGECACDCCGCTESCRTWYIDYRIQEMFGYTSYQFGSHPIPSVYESGLTTPYAPESKLNYSLDSTWDRFAGWRAKMQLGCPLRVSDAHAGSHRRRYKGL